MEESILVTAVDALKTLISHHADLLLVKSTLFLLDMFVDVSAHKFKDEKQAVFLPDDLLQFDNVRMREFPQRLDFTQVHGLVPRSKGLAHLLDCDDFVGGLVASFVNSPEGAIADMLDGFILVHALNYLI